MAAKYTPGPWRQLVTRVDDSSGYQICHLDLHGKSEAERDANRRLIAAAPDLLTSLQALMSRDLETRLNGFPEVQAARAAIAKATGAAL